MSIPYRRRRFVEGLISAGDRWFLCHVSLNPFEKLCQSIDSLLHWKLQRVSLLSVSTAMVTSLHSIDCSGEILPQEPIMWIEGISGKFPSNKNESKTKKNQKAIFWKSEFWEKQSFYTGLILSDSPQALTPACSRTRAARVSTFCIT